jgi:twitching motility protein PilT
MQQPNHSPYPSRGGGETKVSLPSATDIHPAIKMYPDAFVGASAERTAELVAAYNRFENILTDCLHELPDLSDIQFVGGGVVWVHANGEERRTSITLDNDKDLLAWAQLFGRGGTGAKDLAEHHSGAVENAIDIAGVRLRMTFRRQMGGYGLNIRLLSQDPPLLSSTRFERNPVPQKLVDMVLNNSYGFVIITGPTGSGKTTMLAALIAEINMRQHRHIYTVEDPIEFVHLSRESLITQRQVGTDVDTFAQGMITAKRSKPGVILLGELRDKEVMRAAIESAGEGHLVLATTHASNVHSTISSFVGNFTADEQPEIRQRLAGSLRGVIVQRLVKTTDGKMVPAREFLVVDDTIASKIRETSSSEKLAAAINSAATKKAGSFSFDDDLLALCEAGQISVETAMLHAVQKTEVREKLIRKGFDVPT